MALTNSDPGGASPHAAEDGGEIDKISERLTNLAYRINDYNTTRRSGLLTAKPVGDYLPSFLNTLAKRTDPGYAPPRAALVPPPRPAKPEAVPETPSLDRDPDGRLWPQLPTDQMFELEDKIKDQAAELARRNVQIAEMANARQSLANDLETAFDQIDRLSKAMAELKKMSSDREGEVAEATQKLIQSETEKIALQMQLANERKEVNQLSLRLLNIEGILNDKTLDAAASRETAESLSAEMALARDTAERCHAEQLKQVAADYEKRVADYRARIDGRDRIIRCLEKTNVALAGCCDELSLKISALETLQEHAGETIHAQVGYIEFLETVTAVERENAQATIKELIDEFQRERERVRAQEKASAEFRKNIVQLLPVLEAKRIAALKDGTNDSPAETGGVSADAKPDSDGASSEVAQSQTAVSQLARGQAILSQIDFVADYTKVA